MPTTGNPILDVAAVITALGAAAAGLHWLVVKPAVWTRRQLRTLENFWRDWFGEEERPGVDARPGVVERVGRIEDGLDQVDQRLNTVEGEVQLNGGRSVKDTVNRIESHMSGLSDRIGRYHGEGQ